MADKSASWDRLAVERLHSLVETRYAVHWLEAEAVLAEGDLHSHDQRPHVQPHHLSTARQQLVSAGAVMEQSAPTRGGRSITLLTPAEQRGRTTKIARAAQRKRILAARYLGWAQGGATYRHGIIGPTGERVVRRSILASGSMRLIHPDGGEVSRMLNVPLGAPLDSGGLLPTGDFDDPGPVVAVPVEVKRIRDWIYPTSKELFQVLHKAAVIQRARPEALVLPTLVCRRAHYTTFRMAKDLGFFVVDLLVQYVSKAASTPTHFDDIRNELGFQDLRWETDIDSRLVRRVRITLPAEAHSLAEAWQDTAADDELAALINRMRRQHTPSARAQLMSQLRMRADQRGAHTGW